MSLAEWFEARVPTYEARGLLIKLTDDGYVSERMYPTQKGEQAAHEVLDVLDQVHPGWAEVGKIEGVLELADGALCDLPRKEKVGKLLLLGLYLDQASTRRVERAEFGERIGRKIC